MNPKLVQILTKVTLVFLVIFTGINLLLLFSAPSNKILSVLSKLEEDFVTNVIKKIENNILKEETYFIENEININEILPNVDTSKLGRLTAYNSVSVSF